MSPTHFRPCCPKEAHARKPCSFLPEKNILKTARQASPVFVIAASSLAAASMKLGTLMSFAFGTFVMPMFAILAFRAPWHGLPAIFPLASSLHPMPAGMGYRKRSLPLRCLP